MSGQERVNALNPGKNLTYASNPKYSLKTKEDRMKAMNPGLDLKFK